MKPNSIPSVGTEDPTSTTADVKTSNQTIAKPLFGGWACRVQRSRTQKQVSPNGLPIIYVGRPTVWGNPFKLFGDMVYVDAGHRRKILDKWVYLCQGDIEKVLRLYKTVVTGFMQVGEYGIEVDNFHDISQWVKHFKTLHLSDLKGKNLSCWCSLSCQCHADILLELANR